VTDAGTHELTWRHTVAATTASVVAPAVDATATAAATATATAAVAIHPVLLGCASQATSPRTKLCVRSDARLRASILAASQHNIIVTVTVTAEIRMHTAHATR